MSGRTLEGGASRAHVTFSDDSRMNWIACTWSLSLSHLFLRMVRWRDGYCLWFRSARRIGVAGLSLGAYSCPPGIFFNLSFILTPFFPNKIYISRCKEDTAITCHLKQSTSCLIGVCQNIKQHFGILAKARNLQHLQSLEAIFTALRNLSYASRKKDSRTYLL